MTTSVPETSGRGIHGAPEPVEGVHWSRSAGSVWGIGAKRIRVTPERGRKRGSETRYSRVKRGDRLSVAHAC
ncbi:hypothetical protein GCM10009747_27580 [Agromyces humatus]|uniref:Uncharacterized protein n=1 Tax=Agromyces humatus TaxID=279573 RepID=A0ABP4WYN2_9MICO